ncbi:MAG: NAD-dependent epimerase/dehydratase family protein [bacterium]
MSEVETFYKDKKVLVTGGAGFIGSHLVEKLVKLGAHVTILDNFSTGNLNNLSPIITQINVLYADITSPYSCIKATTNKDIVFHLAAFISVPGSIENPDFCHKVNVEGTKNILQACVENKTQTLVLSSSAAVYGDKEDPCTENDLPNPTSPYGKSKVEGEKLCKEYAQTSALATACLRYFNVYGERQDPNGHYAAAAAKFKQNLLNKKPITIYGDGKQTRDFVHVSKVVQANLTIAHIAQQENLKGEIFNVGTGKSINLFQLVEILEQELNTKTTEFTFLPSRSGDIPHSQANCEKYKRVLAKI